ncbi:MAG: ribosomal protein S18-alanine N-acetyltransferase [Thermoplasmatales archaeon]|nr:ribosomal protein S18-alanine N-acetyltransferase [Thermoplasmatales archaeon]
MHECLRNVIRRCSEDDLKEVLEIENLSFNYPYPPYFFYEYLNKLFFVAEENGKIVGYIIGDSERNMIISIAVHPSHRRKGYGKKLMEHLLKFMKGDVFLQVRKSNNGAIKFYENMGFKKKGEIKNYYFDGEDAYIMVKRID